MLIGGFGNAFAAPNIVNNGSFETVDASVTCDPPGFHTVPSPDTTITGWTVGLDSIDWICGYWPAQDGIANLDMSGTNPADPEYDGIPSSAGSVSQDLTTISGATYDVAFWLSGNTDGGSDATKHLTVTAPGYSAPFTHLTTGKGTDWEEKTFSFTAASTVSTLTFTSDDARPFGAALDNVSVVLSRCPSGFDLVDDTCISSNQNPVAGELVPLNTTALFISGLSSSMIWMVPTLVGIAGAGFYFIQARTYNKDN